MEQYCMLRKVTEVCGERLLREAASISSALLGEVQVGRGPKREYQGSASLCFSVFATYIGGLLSHGSSSSCLSHPVRRRHFQVVSR